VNERTTDLTRPKAAGLRILHYIPGIRLEQGGVVRAVLDWCAVFARRDHQMSLVAYEGQDIPRDWLGRHGKPGVPEAFVIPAPMPVGRQLAKAALTFLADVLDRTDVLHLHAPWLPGNRQLANLARLRGVPYVVTTHGMLDDWSMNQRSLKKWIYLKLIGRRFLNGAACIHCTADRELAQASKWFDNRSTRVIPYLVNLQQFETLPGPELGLELLPASQREQRKLLFLSRLHPKKGLDILIRALAILRERGERVVLMVAGTGEPAYERHLAELVNELGLKDHVLFLGLVTGKQKISLYQLADLFVLPTLQENFGLVLVEALASGTPVLTTNGTDIWRELEQAGGVIAPHTPGAIAQAAAHVLSDPTERAQRGQQGRAWVLKNLAVDPVSRQYEMLYAELTQRRCTRQTC
jgi:glycosyltransferase involved in cell wall biosynthesis